MRGIITADWHLRASRPVCRIDQDWIRTQEDILYQVGKAAVSKKCNVYIVGDIFNSNSDTSTECIQLVQDFAKSLGEYNLSVGILAGNHDLLYHSSDNLRRSAIGILFKTENINPIQSLVENSSAPNFDQSVEDKEFVFRHVLVFKDKDSKPFYLDAKTSEDLLEETPNAKWIFTGDYHKSFHYEDNDRHVINPGCLIREVSDFKDYKCGVYYIDTDKNIVEFIEIKDAYDNVDNSHLQENDERDERISEFISSLQSSKSVTLDFKQNVLNVLEENKNISDELRDLIMKLLEVI